MIVSGEAQARAAEIEARYGLDELVCDDFEFCGSPKELREELGTDWMKDSSAEFWAANANFDHAFWTKEFGPTAKPWQCVLDRAAAEQLPRSLGEVSRVVLGSKLDKSIRDNMRGVVFAQLPEAEQLRSGRLPGGQPLEVTPAELGGRIDMPAGH